TFSRDWSSDVCSSDLELHEIAGNSPERVIEVHGTIRRAMCWSCQRRYPMDEILDRVRAGEDDPRCPACGGILKSDTISFGQALEIGRASCREREEFDG